MTERNGGVVGEAAGVRQDGREQPVPDAGHDRIRKNAVIDFIGFPDAKGLVVPLNSPTPVAVFDKRNANRSPVDKQHFLSVPLQGIYT